MVTALFPVNHHPLKILHAVADTGQTSLRAGRSLLGFPSLPMRSQLYTSLNRREFGESL
jgi:hypothetical protein